MAFQLHAVIRKLPLHVPCDNWGQLIRFSFASSQPTDLPKLHVLFSWLLWSPTLQARARYSELAARWTGWSCSYETHLQCSSLQLIISGSFRQRAEQTQATAWPRYLKMDIETKPNSCQSVCKNQLPLAFSMFNCKCKGELNKINKAIVNEANCESDVKTCANFECCNTESSLIL